MPAITVKELEAQQSWVQGRREGQSIESMHNWQQGLNALLAHEDWKQSSSEVGYSRSGDPSQCPENTLHSNMRVKVPSQPPLPRSCEAREQLVVHPLLSTSDLGLDTC